MSKVLMGCACAGTVLGGMYVHGDLSGGQIYNVPLHDAYLRAQALSPAYSNLMIDGGKSGTSFEKYPDEAVKYALSIDGHAVGKLAATFRSAGEGRTRVWVAFEEGDGEATPAVQRIRTEWKTVGAVAMAESIGAAIEQRPVNKSLIQSAQAAHMTAHAQDVFADVAEKMNESAADFHRQDAEDDYRKAQSQAGKPSVDLSHKGR